MNLPTREEARALARGYMDDAVRLVLAKGPKDGRRAVFRKHLQEARRLGLLPSSVGSAAPGSLWQGPFVEQDGGAYFHGPQGLKVLAGLNIDADGGLWYHVSYSRPDRVPDHDDTCAVRAAFFDPLALVVQLFPPVPEYVNDHPRCLHLWQSVCRERLIPDLRVEGTI